jgi:NADH dehydrogenase
MSFSRQQPTETLVTVFGGSGFVGRHVVRALAKRGHRIRVAVRRPDLAGHLQPLGGVGQISPVQANVRNRASIERALEGAHAVVNLVGILQEGGRQRFDAVQAFGARIIAEAAAARGIDRLVHISALGADPDSASQYARTKAEGEAGVRAAIPGAVIVRPSVIFGPEDQFFNRFAELARILPVLPLAGGDTRMQPVFVGDVAAAVARAVDGAVAAGVYELGGPETHTLRELVDYVLATTRRRTPIMALPLPLARLQAWLTEVATTVTLSMWPQVLRITRDQVRLLQVDNVVSDAATREGRTLEGIGITPTGYDAIVPTYLWRFRKTGQFDSSDLPPASLRQDAQAFES